ncbi:MAG: short-chain dehydrogenase [Anaerolineae bacterium]|mgnify:CR=1 FL=1|nr:short-chain dehydrogenase [Ardenticatenia bacterium]HQZ69811.1 short-chain dehydrogenase [Anaerolineae bacterium]HRA21414.1 short-chain dehydrogenase [Anaerolineae bacterium]
MDIKGRTALVLGGAGLVGRAICRDLILAGAGRILVGGLSEAESRTAVGDLARLHPASSTQLLPVWGNVFVRDSLSGLRPDQIRADDAARGLLLADALDELSPAAYRASLLVQLILGTSRMAEGVKPDVIVDAVNTATALAYGGIYPTIRRVLAKRAAAVTGAGADADLDLGEDIDDLLAAQAIPMLVRHVQLASQAMIQAGTKVYVKIGTTGTGGMGLNIPYTHGEEKPSRTLLSKSALAGAHSMLLLLLARTPGAPAVKEIKPGAAITWKGIHQGPIHHRGRPMGRFDAEAANALRLESGAAFSLTGAGRDLGQPLESVYIDTGENGLFSVAEYAAITALGQMEAVTPEEIAAAVLREIRGQTSGMDIVAALDSTIMRPSYRAGVLRAHAIAEARALVAASGLPSIAFEILGPPRLSKLLYEGEFLRLAFGSLEAVGAAPDGAAVAEAMDAAVRRHDAVRQAAISVGIPILLGDGVTLLAAERGMAQHDWERPGWLIDEAALETRSQAEWIDLRVANGEQWLGRIRAILAERQTETASGVSSSRLDRRFSGDAFDIGEVAAWIFIHEDQGGRIA